MEERIYDNLTSEQQEVITTLEILRHNLDRNTDHIFWRDISISYQYATINDRLQECGLKAINLQGIEADDLIEADCYELLTDEEQAEWESKAEAEAKGREGEDLWRDEAWRDFHSKAATIIECIDAYLADISE